MGDAQEFDLAKVDATAASFMTEAQNYLALLQQLEEDMNAYAQHNTVNRSTETYQAWQSVQNDLTSVRTFIQQMSQHLSEGSSALKTVFNM